MRGNIKWPINQSPKRDRQLATETMVEQIKNDF